MKGAVIGLLIGIAILALFAFTNSVRFTPTTLDVHVHDTYFVLDHLFVGGFLFVFLGTCFSIGGLISTRFRGEPFWFLFISVVLIAAFYIFDFFNEWNASN